MHKLLIGIVAVAAIVIGATPASAQRRTTTQRTTAPRVPAEGMWALGGSIGAVGTGGRRIAKRPRSGRQPRALFHSACRFAARLAHRGWTSRVTHSPAP